MLRWRLLLGFSIIAALVGLCWLDHLAPAWGWFPGVFLLPVGALFVLLASSELIGMLEAGGMKPCKGIVYAGNLLLFASAWLPAAWTGISTLIRTPELTPDAFAGMLVVFWGCIFAAFLVNIGRYEKPGGHLANLAATVFALSYLGIMFFFSRNCD